jgi:TetR/AcrR family acrAB operon transcriptional repressor
MMRRTKEEAEQTRQDLLDAALTVFSRKGYSASRLEDIASAAGVTRGAIYHHFGSKADLYRALIDEANTVGNSAIARAVDGGGNYIEIVTRILVYTFELLEDDRRFSEVMALQLNTPEAEGFSQQRYDEAQQLVTSISGLFKLIIEQGELRQDLDPDTVARAFLGYQYGLSSLWLFNREVFSIKESAPELAEIFVRGIAS